MIDGAHRFDPRQRGHAMQHLFIKRKPLLRLRLFGAGDGDHGTQHMMRLEAGIDSAQRKEGADHQPSANQQQKGQSKFRTHQRAAQAVAPQTLAASPSAFLQSIAQIDGAGLQRGHDTEDDPRKNRNHRGKQQHSRIQPDRGSPRHRRRRQCHEHADTPERQQQSRCAAQ
jgi:hypothetical protein